MVIWGYSNSGLLFQMWDGNDDRLSEEYEDDFDSREGAGSGVVGGQDVIQKQIVKIKNTVNVAIKNYVNSVTSVEGEARAKEEGMTTVGVPGALTGSRMKERLATKLHEAVTEGVQVMKDAMENVNGTTISQIDKQILNVMDDSKNASLAVREQVCADKAEVTSLNLQIVLIIGGIVIGIVLSITVYFCTKYLR